MNPNSESSFAEEFEETLDQTLAQDEFETMEQTILQEAPPSPKKMIGKYELEELLGKGGMGEVWKSRHPGLDIPVAIKILKPELVSKSEKFRNRFLQEGKLAASINHPGVIRVFDAGDDNGKFYLVMEFVKGEDYHQIFKNNSDNLSVDEVVEMLLVICDSLGIAHKNGIVHRDIKPDNIMKTQDGEIKLADLGIAKFEGSEFQNTMEGSALGTPYYISPEQARDASSVDSRSDIYSLGATAYHLLTGSYPFNANSAVNMLLKHIHEPLEEPVKRDTSIPEELSDIICKMMEKDRENRYQTVEEVKAALIGFQNKQHAEDSNVTSEPEPSKQKPSFVPLWAALVFLLLTGVLIVKFRSTSKDIPPIGINEESAAPVNTSLTKQEPQKIVADPVLQNQQRILFEGKGVKPNTFKSTGWTLSEKKDFIHLKRNSTLNPYLFIPHSDSFTIKLQMRIADLNHSACSIALDNQVFGLTGKDGQFYTSGGQFGRKVSMIGSNKDYISPNREFELTIRYTSGEITYFIDQRQIFKSRFVFVKIKNIELRSNRSSIDVLHFSVSGDSSWVEGFFTGRTLQSSKNKNSLIQFHENGQAVYGSYLNKGAYLNAEWQFKDGKIFVERFYRDSKEELLEIDTNSETDSFAAVFRGTPGQKFVSIDEDYKPHEFEKVTPLFFFENDFDRNFEKRVTGLEIPNKNKLLTDTISVKDSKYKFYTKNDYSDFELHLSYKIDATDSCNLYLRTRNEGKKYLRVQLNGAQSNGEFYPAGSVFKETPKGNVELLKGNWNHMRVILQKEKLKVFINGSLVNEVNVSTSNLTSGKIGFGGPGKGTMQIRRISIKDLSYVPAISGFYFSKMKDFKSMEITKGLKLIYRNEKDNTDVSKYGQGVIEFISEVKREGKKYLFKDQSGKVRALTIVGDGLLKLDSTGNYFVRIKDY